MATKSITVYVRKKHWQAAQEAVRIIGEEMQIKTNSCPIAQALRIKFKGYYIRVYPDYSDKVLVGTRGRKSPVYTLDKAGADLVEAFDSQYYNYEDVNWTQRNPKVKPILSEGTRTPKFPVKVILKPCI